MKHRATSSARRIKAAPRTSTSQRGKVQCGILSGALAAVAAVLPSVSAQASTLFPANFPIDNFSSSNGFFFGGNNYNENAGYALSGVKDVNGDQIDDLVIGAPLFPGQGVPLQRGKVYVVYGRNGNFPFVNALKDVAVNGTNGFRGIGTVADEQFGFSVSGAGDLNNDGLNDVIFGAPFYSPGVVQSGQGIIAYGRAATSTPITLTLNSSISSSDGLQFQGASSSKEYAFLSSAPLGDINGDGIDDCIVGAKGTGTYAGSAYVLYGKQGGPSPTPTLTALDGTNGFTLHAEHNFDSFGCAVASAGDFNGDGIPDILVGAERAESPAQFDNSSHFDSGRAFLLFGRSTNFPASLNVNQLDGTNGFALTSAFIYDNAGYSVAGAGDVNGDGFDDILIGASYTTGAPTDKLIKAYLVFGKASGFGTNLDLSTLNGTNGCEIIGESSNKIFGRNVSSIGDFNGDGYSDFALANPTQDSYNGKAYIVYGKGTPFPAQLNLSALDGTNGFAITSITNTVRLGQSVTHADLNGDGGEDLIVGAPWSNYEDNSGDLPGSEGKTYVIYGQIAHPPQALASTTVKVNKGAAPVTVNLAPLFSSPVVPSSQLTYSVRANNNAALFTATAIQSGTNLVLAFNKSKTGSAIITVRAAQGGLYAQTTVKVAVSTSGDFLGNDNFADLLIESKGALSVARITNGVSNGQSKLLTTLPSTKEKAVAAADFNGDAITDIVTQNGTAVRVLNGTNFIGAVTNIPTATVTTLSTLSLGKGEKVLGSGNLLGTSANDLLIQKGAKTLVYVGKGNGKFSTNASPFYTKKAGFTLLLAGQLGSTNGQSDVIFHKGKAFKALPANIATNSAAVVSTPGTVLSLPQGFSKIVAIGEFINGNDNELVTAKGLKIAVGPNTTAYVLKKGATVVGPR